jgi:hypothetical protein
VLPRNLFRNSVFNVTSAIGFVVGFALFGSVTYLPLFLQVVNGASPTGSGLQILPLMGGLLITSIGSGQIITRTGKYKVFPIFGTFVMVIGLFLLSRMDATTSRLTASLFMFVLGLGLGSVMQVLVLAVQNAVEYKDLGVATSGATLFRSIGGSVGTAILGSIFSTQLKSNLTADLHANLHAVAGLPHSQIAKLSGSIGNPQSLKALPTALHDIYISSFTSSLNTVFEVAAGVAAVSFFLSLVLEERPLRDTAEASTGIGETFAVPKPGDSLPELARALAVVVGRDRRRQFVEQITVRAGVDLSPAAAWLLVRKHCEPEANLEQLSADWDVPLDRAAAGQSELIERGFMSSETSVNPEGDETAVRLIAARREELAKLVDGWGAEEDPEVADLLTRLAEQLEPATAVG